MKRMLILLCLFVAHIAQGDSDGIQIRHSFNGGFASGTLVKTPQGYTPIEELKVGDKVICLGYQGQCVEAPIERVFRKKAQEWHAIDLKNGTLFVQPHHKFYDAYIQQWVSAKDLDEGSLLLHGCTNTHIVFDNRKVESNTLAYDLTIADYHNFFVSEHEIVVHNVIPLFAYGAEGLAFVGWEAVGAGLASTALGIGATWLVNKVMTKVFGATGSADYAYNEFVMHEILDDIKHQAEKAPGKPTENDGFIPSKNSDGKKVRAENGRGWGWKDKGGSIWIPSGINGHGCPHWDVQHPDGSYDNIVPGGRIRGQK